MKAYSIICFYQNEYKSNDIIEKGCLLEYVQERCDDKESSSRTCISKEGNERTKLFGAWFYGYEEE